MEGIFDEAARCLRFVKQIWIVLESREKRFEFVFSGLGEESSAKAFLDEGDGLDEGDIFRTLRELPNEVRGLASQGIRTDRRDEGE
mgnify:CR=1 FL=1